MVSVIILVAAAIVGLVGVSLGILMKSSYTSAKNTIYFFSKI